MTIREALHKYKAIEIHLLLEHVLQKPKEFLYLNPDYLLRVNELTSLKQLIKRRKKNEPVAYILGYKYFYGLKIKVDKRVLIPRPETEWIIDHALALIRTKPTAAQITLLDVGTGSGCIPISTAANLAATEKKRIKIYASDISGSALAVAKINNRGHKTKVTFVKSDLFASITGTFNIVTSNLPYVPHSRYHRLLAGLKYEPKTAITDNTDTSDIYQRFFTQLPHYLKPGGTALLEIDEDAKAVLSRLLKKILPEYKAVFTKDLAGMWRYLRLDRPEKK